MTAVIKVGLHYETYDPIATQRQVWKAADEAGFDQSSFSRNGPRFFKHDVAGEFFRTVVAEARELKLTSDENFTVDGTLIEAWASLKSLRPKGEKPARALLPPPCEKTRPPRHAQATAHDCG